MCGLPATPQRRVTEAGAGPQAVGRGEGDPGYGSTHRMVLEAALALALEVPPPHPALFLCHIFRHPRTICAVLVHL